MAPRPNSIRHKVEPADVTPAKAARRLSLTEAEFAAVLPRLIERGFPKADPDTGMYDLEAIDLWRKARNPQLYGLTPANGAEQPAPRASMGDRFHETTKRIRDDRATTVRPAH